MTLAHLHLDRVASAWLISRFVDPEAEFEYLGWDAARPDDDDVTLFGMPGVALASQDESGTCFSRILKAYNLDNPALALLERVVASGVDHAVGREPDRSLAADLRSVGIALDILGTGLGVMADDPAHLERATIIYDALLCVCRIRTLPVEIQDQIPRLPGDRAAFLRDALAVD